MEASRTAADSAPEHLGWGVIDQSLALAQPRGGFDTSTEPLHSSPSSFSCAVNIVVFGMADSMSEADKVTPLRTAQDTALTYSRSEVND